MNSHNFQDDRVETSQERQITHRERSWKGGRFYRTPTGVRNKRVNHSENVNASCIRTVFKIKSWNFTGTSSTTPRQVVEGLTILPFPHMGQKYRVNQSKNVNSTCICTVFKMKSWHFTGTSVTLRDRSWKGWPFYLFLIGVRNKRLITLKTWTLHDVNSHSFQDTIELKLHRNVDDSSRQVVEELTFLPVPLEGSGIKG